MEPLIREVPRLANVTNDISVTTQLQRQDSLTTTVITTVDAVARPVLFTGEYNHCGTRGELEARISNDLKGIQTP